MLPVVPVGGGETELDIKYRHFHIVKIHSTYSSGFSPRTTEAL